MGLTPPRGDTAPAKGEQFAQEKGQGESGTRRRPSGCLTMGTGQEEMDRMLRLTDMSRPPVTGTGTGVGDGWVSTGALRSIEEGATVLPSDSDAT